ncbi:MAG: 50S ribosomal protein L3 N(5)-glutamine methyltransferase [Gammaproteobacteria bacterium]
MQAPPSAATVEQLLNWAEQQLSTAAVCYGHGTDNPADEACYLVFATLGLPFDAPDTALQQQAAAAQQALVVQRVRQRIEQHIPVAYLVQQAWFAGLPFYVNEHVLIPRSPIAELIEERFSPWVQAARVSRVLDIGTGCGCIAVACALAFADAQVDAVDVSAAALKVAAHNVKQHRLEQRVNLITSDVFSALTGQRYDIIVSNPPYVSADEYQALPAEYRHEPAAALLAGAGGMDIIQLILERAHEFLHDDGILIVETGSTQDTVQRAYPQLPFVWLEFARGGDGVFLLNKSDLDGQQNERA